MPAKLGSRDDLGLALTLLRSLKGLEQEELAAASGVSLSAVQAIEQGKRRQPTLKTITPITSALGVDLATVAEMVSFIRRVRRGPETFPAASGSWPAALGADSALTGSAAFRREVSALIQAQLDAGDRDRAAQSPEPDRRREQALWPLVAACSAPALRALVRQISEFQTAGFCELLCDESLRAAADDAERAARLAELAVEVAERVAGPEGWRWRMLGYARAHLANALRVGGDLPAAEAAFEQARRSWKAGAAEDPGLVNAARVLHLEASLCRALRRLPEALALLDEALALDRWGETPALLMGKARSLVEVGDFEAALGLLRQAAPQVDADREPRRLYVLRNLLVLNLCHLGRHAEAEPMLPELRALALRLRNHLDLLRVDWLQGRVAAGLGRPEEAIAILERVRAEFVALKNPYVAALITLELAEVHAAMGRSAQVKALARDSAPIFQAHGVHREAQRALRLFCRAAEEERLTAELLRRFVAYLYRARHDPHIAFDPAT
jgi:transcriptional regulator with XRE-family HTH domain